MLSICVTYYNQEKFVSRSLDSIFAQNLKTDYEVLVGDDGSTDNTVRIIEEYKIKYHEKIKLFIMPRDANKTYNPVERASLNRLNLYKHAIGDFICFLDGDDEYCNFNFMQESVEELRINKKISGVAHNFVVLKSDGQKEFHENVLEKKYLNLHDYIKGLYIPAGTMIFRCPKNKKLEKLFTLKSFDDNDITYYFLNEGNVLYRNINVYNYYTNENSICNSTSAFEIKILNAIDYEAIKKIITKKHFLLFLRYFETILDVYNNRSEIQDFIKFKSICVKDGLLDHLYNWDNLTKLQKWIINSKIKIQKKVYDLNNLNLLQRIKEKFIRIIKKVLKIIGVL